MPVPSELAEEFRREKARRTARAIWFVTLITTPLWPLSTYIDWFVFREHFGALTWTRAISGAALAGLLAVQVALRRRGRDAAMSRVIVWAFTVIVCVYFDVATMILAGAESDYARAFLLLLFVLFAALPWSASEVAWPVGFSGIQFLAVTLALDPDVDWKSYLVVFFLLSTTTFIGLFWAAANHRLLEAEFLGRKHLELERQRSESLLLNILPQEVAEELKAIGRVKARSIRSCSILFTDFVGFTALSDRMDPPELIRVLDAVFSRFDAVVAKWGLERLKTIGDAYMAACGILAPEPDHLVRCVLAGLEMYHVLEQERAQRDPRTFWRMRVGVHAGPVVAGVVGRSKFAFDLWGDTVNVAGRLTELGDPGTIALHAETASPVSDLFETLDRGWVEVRGKGPLRVVQVTRLKPEYSEDAAGRLPNDAFLVRTAIRPRTDGVPSPSREPIQTS